MSDTREATNLTELIHTMERMERENAQVSVDDVVHAVGRRSFGPLLLLAGLITLAPIIGDNPKDLLRALSTIMPGDSKLGDPHIPLPSLPYPHPQPPFITHPPALPTATA